MDSPRPLLLILADAPDALVELFGISLLERLLRIAQRLGFREARILSTTPDEIARHLAKPSWARAQISVNVRAREGGPLRVHEQVTGSEPTLVVSADFYFDARLLKTLAEQATSIVLVDSAPPAETLPLWRKEGVDFRSAALLGPDQIFFPPATERTNQCDAASEPTYVSALRKHVRPVFFPAPPPELVPLAEKHVRDLAQNGVL